MPNNYEEMIQQFNNQSQTVTKPKSRKNQVIAYALIGIGIAMSIFLVAEIMGVIGNKKPEPQIDAKASYEARLHEEQARIEEAKRQQQISELRKQATELELQALTIESNDSN